MEVFRKFGSITTHVMDVFDSKLSFPIKMIVLQLCKSLQSFSYFIIQVVECAIFFSFIDLMELPIAPLVSLILYTNFSN